MGIFKKLISNITTDFKNALEEGKEVAMANIEQAKKDIVSNIGQVKQGVKKNDTDKITPDECQEEPNNYHVEVSGDVYSLQIIALDDEYLKFVGENVDNLESVYQEFRDKADDSDWLVEFNFLSEEGLRKMTIYDDDGENLDCDIDNYLNISSYPEAVDYFKTHSTPVDDDYYDEYKKVIGIEKLKCGEYGSTYIEKAIKKIVDKKEYNFIEALIKVVVDEFGSDKNYLLIYGKRQERSSYIYELVDKVCEEYDEDSLMLFGSGTYSNGEIEMEVDSIADSIIYKGYFYGACDIYENHYIEDPVFQIVDSDLKIFDLETIKSISITRLIPILKHKLPEIDPAHLSSSSKLEVLNYLVEISNVTPDLLLSFNDYITCVKLCMTKGLLDDGKEIINKVLNYEKRDCDTVKEVRYSTFLEHSITRALKDGILTDEERKRLKHRAEMDGEDWDEVEMVIEARIAEMKKKQTGKISEGLESLISTALLDGVITEKELTILKRRAEREGVEWNFVEKYIEERLNEKNKRI